MTEKEIELVNNQRFELVKAIAPKVTEKYSAVPMDAKRIATKTLTIVDAILKQMADKPLVTEKVVEVEKVVNHNHCYKHTTNIPLTKENFIKCWNECFDAAKKNPENIKYGYTFDIRGKATCELGETEFQDYGENEAETAFNEFKEFIELYDKCEELRKSIEFSLDIYWNDADSNHAEEDSYGFWYDHSTKSMSMFLLIVE